MESTALVRRYGAVVSVDHVQLSVPKGSIYGFLGPNGAGKTTTLRMVLGLIRPTSGTVRVFGRDVGRERLAVLRRVGALIEAPAYYGHLTGRENLRVLTTLLGLPAGRADEVLALVRLSGVADRRAGGYSLGMKQRLGIAMAMLQNPDLLVLDEPTNGLDPAGIHEMRELLKSLAREHGVTVLVSSHLLAEVEQVASHVGIIQRGRLLFQGEMAALRERHGVRTVLEVDDAASARAVLAEAGIAADAAGDGLMLRSSDRAEAARANRALVLAGRAVFRLAPDRPSLEDLFLDLVGTEASL